ncbi:MAG: NAD-dependent epimerase/dehydratase family protein, partial [Longimicrobiales bacterium]
MSPTRRDFVKTTSLVSAGLALGGAAGCSGAQESAEGVENGPSPKKILMLGGTGFIGPHMVRYAVERGHEVTIFTR